MPTPDVPALKIDRLAPENYRRMPWKNGGGVLVQIAGEDIAGAGGSVSGWHYGRTAITVPGPFSDLTGYERLQVMIKGQGLVLVTPDGDIDLRHPFRPQRYDGATPIVTRLESGAVEVANLIARRDRYRIDLQVGSAGDEITCAPGVHIVHAAAEAAHLHLGDIAHKLAHDHALRLCATAEARLLILEGRVLIASVYAHLPA